MKLIFDLTLFKVEERGLTSVARRLGNMPKFCPPSTYTIETPASLPPLKAGALEHTSLKRGTEQEWRSELSAYGVQLPFQPTPLRPWNVSQPTLHQRPRTIGKRRCVVDLTCWCGLAVFVGVCLHLLWVALLAVEELRADMTEAAKSLVICQQAHLHGLEGVCAERAHLLSRSLTSHAIRIIVAEHEAHWTELVETITGLCPAGSFCRFETSRVIDTCVWGFGVLLPLTLLTGVALVSYTAWSTCDRWKHTAKVTA